jgi:hypothetical protein
MLAWAGFLAIATPTLAWANYNEATDPEISGDAQNPTAIALTPMGLTSISGSITGAGSGVSTDIDYFKVTVPSGQFLGNVFVRTGTTAGGNGSFIGLFPGAVGKPAASTTGADLLGYYLYKPADIGTDILDDMGTFTFNGNTSQHFTPPLPAGDYTFWVQEGSLGTFNYNFDLALVPEPTSCAVMLAGAGMLTMRRRRAMR